MQKRKKGSNIHFDTTLCSEDKKYKRKRRIAKEDERLETHLDLSKWVSSLLFSED